MKQEKKIEERKEISICKLLEVLLFEMFRKQSNVANLPKADVSSQALSS